MRVQGVLAAILWMTLAAQAVADEIYQFPADQAEAAFISDEVIMTFYHELGHALIDVQGLPVLGREEDAADSLSVVLMDEIWQEEAATEILTSDATSYRLMAEQDAANGLDALFADQHSLNIQRYYNVVCLFYGANPELRGRLASDLGLPPEREDSCPDEFAQAAGSWDAVLQAADQGDGTDPALVLDNESKGLPLGDVLAEEIKSLNDKISLPEQVTVRVDHCDEANAFYNAQDRSITLCNEYAGYLQELWEADAGQGG